MVKGSAITSTIRYIRDHHDDVMYREIRDSLSPEHRALLKKGVVPHEWVPYSLFIELSVATDARLGQGDLTLCRDIGRYGARVNLPTLYRLFMRLGSVGFILRKASRLWSVHYDTGSMEVEELTNRAARLTIGDFDEPHRAHCLRVLGWTEGAIEMTGSQLLGAEKVSCRTEGDEACVLHLRWR